MVEFIKGIEYSFEYGEDIFNKCQYYFDVTLLEFSYEYKIFRGTINKANISFINFDKPIEEYNRIINDDSLVPGAVAPSAVAPSAAAPSTPTTPGTPVVNINKIFERLIIQNNNEAKDICDNNNLIRDTKYLVNRQPLLRQVINEYVFIKK